MIFEHTKDQLDLRDGTREFLRGTCTVEWLRELRDQEGSDSLPNIWNQLHELGLVDFMVSEDLGGLGMDAIGLTLIAQEAGYVALPDPLIDVAGVAAPIMSSLNQAPEARVRTVHSLNPFINQLASQDSLLVFEESKLRLLSADQYKAEAVNSIDPLRRLAKVSFDSNAGELIADDSRARALSAEAMNYGALFTAAELLGLSAAMIDMATSYAQERQQFGKPIGSYQAVKHHLATALVKLEFARPVVYRASFEVADSPRSAALSVAHAKVAASDAAIHAAEAAIQVHGAMGYTFEVDLHLWMKRAWALAGQWGDRNFHMQRLETEIFDNSIEIGPAQTFRC